MTNETYFNQMMRLSEAFGSKLYTKPRLTLIAREVKHYSDHVFERAVNRLIMTNRSTPLLLEIKEACEAVVAEDKQRERENAPQLSMVEQLCEAAKRTTADKDFVQACLKTLQHFLDGKISKSVFLSHCNELDSVARQIGTAVSRGAK